MISSTTLITDTFTATGSTYAIWIPASILQLRIEELGTYIARVYQGKHLRLTVILKGGKPFADALFAAITAAPDGPASIETDALRVKSYSGTQSGTLEWKQKPGLPGDADVHELVIDDIVDTGKTIAAVASAQRARGMASVATVALLDRPEARTHTTTFTPDFVAFEVPNPDVWAVGFGMDIDEQYRELPAIYGKVLPGQTMPAYHMPKLAAVKAVA